MTRLTDVGTRLTADGNISNQPSVIPLADSLLRFHQQHETAEPVEGEFDANVLVSVVMPCLNEARTLAACIEQADAGCRSALASRNLSGEAAGSATQTSYEIIIADNGSTDGSQAIAIAHGAKVVSVEQKGYGAALQGGIAAARGKYVVMGDSDCSYDFGEVPRFLDKLEEGYDLVMGNRFAGGIMPGAMPWHHRYIGNPVLSGIGRLLYRTPCKDWHCGLRAFDREKIQDLHLSCTGMEFASEMIIRASQLKFGITEVSTTLRPDGRDRPPHLRSIRDGWRHLMIMVKTSTRSSFELIVIAFVLPLVFACLYISIQSIEKPLLSAEFPEPVIIDLGVLPEGIAEIECKVTATSDASIIGVQTSCGCIWTEDPPLNVQKNEKKLFSSQLTLKKSKRSLTPNSNYKSVF